jgi:type IV pilus assembly protein PilW
MTEPSTPASCPHGKAYCPIRRSDGFSLVELMVASAVGLLVVGGLVTVFVQTGRSNTAMARLNEQMENGRFAQQLLREDLWHAGYWGEYRPPDTAPTAMPPLCAAFAAWAASDMENVLRVPVIGSDNSVPTGCDTVVNNRKAGTDVLIVRHASTCVADTGTDNNCENFAANKAYLQVSLCSADPQAYVMATDSDVSTIPPFTLLKRDGSGNGCTAPGYSPTNADRRKLISNLYYIGDDDTLRRSELDYESPSVVQQSAQVLVGGIEHMEVEYGVDTDDDGSADSFTSDPATLSDWTVTRTSQVVDTAWEKWANVVAVQIHLLARSSDPTPGYTDTKTYQLGTTTLPPFNDGLSRHVYSSFMRLYNISGRRDRP